MDVLIKPCGEKKEGNNVGGNMSNTHNNIGKDK